MRISRLATLAATVMALAACTPDRPTDAPEAVEASGAPDGVLVAITGSGDVAIDAASGAVLAGGQDTVASPGGDALYGAAVDGGPPRSRRSIRDREPRRER